ncbi:hypothetical protein TrST_g4160 [Triparma strigata]|uniref:WW domain-containing protein n=1 Tax=Triparma strigata TaxID=1606541 RepID=A0A9W6ZNR1_9STRA|nr:hypothetical protein TrST_g4160 [Triparma strigata]
MILAGSFLSFAVAAYYSAAIATNRKKMMQLKVATTFFQTAELTTLIKVSWPSIVYFTLPFQLPISDTKCLAASSGWNQLHTFYAYIYGPILIFSVPLLSASGTQPRSSERKKVAGLLTVLISLWYSPLLQTIASIRNLFQIAEVSSTITCMIGNALALIASFTDSDQSFIDLLRGVMATTNILYFILFMCKYNRELEKALDREAEWSAGVKVNSNLGAELKDAVGEWNLLVMSLENDDDPWISATNDEGKLYYINRETNETTWEKP